jgi:hypothetical protein
MNVFQLVTYILSYNMVFCEISSFHGGEYEAQNLLGCTAVFLNGCRHPVKNTAVHPRRF